MRLIPTTHCRLLSTDLIPKSSYPRRMLGEELQKARKRAGLTQETLAFEARVDRTYISQLEHDKKSPTLEVLFRISKALGVKASVLIARVERTRK